ncbi:c-type cytochrome [Pseudomonas psychrophila]|uniref:c-type cytochrome n=1 Tax=Pseudomonas psychrophila TaxID=122355 RepID=UPI00381BA30D
MTLPVDGEKISGAQLYDAHCSTCHQPQRQGSFEGGLPSLLHNTAVGRSNPNNLVMVILDGVKRGAHGEDIRMQDFARNLSDQQVATLATYLTGHYGNADVKVSAAQVKVLRDGGWTCVAPGGVGPGCDRSGCHRGDPAGDLVGTT